MPPVPKSDYIFVKRTAQSQMLAIEKVSGTSLREVMRECVQWKTKKKTGGHGSGVSAGMSQAEAAAALAAKLGAKNPKPKGGGGGVSTAMSQGGAKNALAGLIGPKRNKPAASKPAAKKAGGGGGGGAGQYAQLFKKYEIMVKLGIDVYGVMERMRQNGEDKAAIDAFGRKHGGVLGVCACPTSPIPPPNNAPCLQSAIRTGPRPGARNLGPRPDEVGGLPSDGIQSFAAPCVFRPGQQ